MDDSQRNINTAGGDAGRDFDKRAGTFTERDFFGAAIYANHGTVNNYVETRKRIAQAEFCRIGMPDYASQPSPLDRTEVIKKLKDAVCQVSGPRLSVLYGTPGVGKTSLVAQLARSITPEQFHNGVLWGNLDILAPHELLSRFLALLPDEPGMTPSRLDAPLRDVFWRRLCGNGAKWLVIIDHVRDRQQLAELLPGSEDVLGQSHICLISHEPFDLDREERRATLHKIDSLTPDEADRLLKHLLTTPLRNGSTKALQHIVELVEYNTQILVSCANLINRGVTDLDQLVEGLLDRGLPQSLLSASQQRTLELIIGDLDEPARAVIPYLGALGAGDWSPKMLAAIALASPVALVEALRAIVASGLITQLDTNHYRTSFLLRQYAADLLARDDPYREQTAYILLARFCLDQAQDLEADLRTRSRKPGEPGVKLSQLDPRFIAEFRQGLTLELPHIRHVLLWAAKRKQWDLIRRFSYLPYLESVQHFTADGFEITTSLLLATIWEPTVWEPSRPASIRIPTIAHTEDWNIFPPGVRENANEGITLTESLESAGDLSGDAVSRRCRLNWTMTASHMVSAVFRETCLTEARWSGVQARELILVRCDAVGAVMQACDLGDSIWTQTDARYARLDGSSLRGALLRNVQLTGASLCGVDLTGAILENVQLRGADLQDANLTSAVLINTTLRGAQLQQAIFRDAILSNVDLQQTKLRPDRFCQVSVIGLAGERSLWYPEADLLVVCPRTADALPPLRLDHHT